MAPFKKGLKILYSLKTLAKKILHSCGKIRFSSLTTPVTLYLIFLSLHIDMLNVNARIIAFLAWLPSYYIDVFLCLVR